MCGIAGVLTARDGVEGMERVGLAMRAALAHRGPDDEGFWQSPARRAMLAHTRLAIIDLSSAGHQPMSTPDGRLTITFNGEIYNYVQLRGELERSGASFRSGSDTEVILRGYEAQGAAFIGKLRGMFALALWDEREQSCLLARDRFGIKPLYYQDQGGTLTFASEVKALLASGLVDAALDPEGLRGYFRSGSVQEPRTILRDVKALEAGTYAVWKDGRLDTTRYWSLKFAPEAIGLAEAQAITRAALIDSVEHHFVSDVPVGIFLSGGIDSTAVLALSRAIGKKDLHTFSIAFPGSSADEGEIARKTAEHFGTVHTEWALDAATGRELFAQFIEVIDQPSIDGFNTFVVSHFASRHGMKVVLSGLGGDELFGGYKSFQQVPRLARWNRRLKRTGPISRGVSSVLGRSERPQLRRLGEMLGDDPSLATAYAALRGVYTEKESRRLVRKYAPSTDPAAAQDAVGRVDAPTDEDAVSALELTRYMRNQLLRDSDVMSMASGLELRVPFVDMELVDRISRIPAEIRLRPGKRLLVEAVPELPPWVVGRPKRGFLFPFDQWIAQDWGEVFAAIEKGSPVPTQTWYRKWSLMVLERWLSASAAVTGSGTPPRRAAA